MAYMELRAACLAAGASLPPPLTVLRFADLPKFRSTDYDWYLAVNPNGKVPTLVDASNHVTMWDSCAIVAYLSGTACHAFVAVPSLVISCVLIKHLPGI